MDKQLANFHFSHAHMAGFGSFVAAILLYLLDVQLSVVPLAIFLLLCIVAPFLPRLSFFLPIVSKGMSGRKAVAITFDDGPDPFSTPALLRLLSRYETKATFFVTGEKVSNHPELIMEILLHGHSIGNHSYSHDNLIMLKSSKTLMKEIESTQDILRKFGITPFAFRPPVGITNPRLWKALRKLGMYNVNFSCRAIEGGNRWIKNLSKRILKRLRSDHIIALHDIRGKDDARFSYWLNEIELILSGIRERGFAIYPLSQLIGRPVMLTRSGDDAFGRD
ncbi:MAG: polysaccharide deacetylase family protein [Proteobacteria bacterium]|nr:polysaccharide deacetylase family protein [Desulfobacterales bacterium]MBL7102519.1 polysaccharide deacetylase family protein [Desulfobacteraceae bacterium]MBU0989908.1 polysaccharide deacetylase family protein [Pseudomonadota bacterium]MBU1904817.1 polysaccharide deacetylase family protein [Pseudomonadota bacterium]